MRLTFLFCLFPSLPLFFARSADRQSLLKAGQMKPVGVLVVEQRWIFGGPFCPPPWAHSHCLRARSLASPVRRLEPSLTVCALDPLLHLPAALSPLSLSACSIPCSTCPPPWALSHCLRARSLASPVRRLEPSLTVCVLDPLLHLSAALSPLSLSARSIPCFTCPPPWALSHCLRARSLASPVRRLELSLTVCALDPLLHLSAALSSLSLSARSIPCFTCPPPWALSHCLRARSLASPVRRLEPSLTVCVLDPLLHLSASLSPLSLSAYSIPCSTCPLPLALSNCLRARSLAPPVRRLEPSLTVCVLDPLLHLSPSGILPGVSILQALVSRLQVSLKRRAGRPTRQLPDASWPYRTSLGMWPSSTRRTWPSHLRRLWRRRE